MSWILDQLFGNRVAQDTERYLQTLKQAPLQASQSNASELLKDLRNVPGAGIPIGKTAWGETVSIPASEVLGSHAIVGGGTGSGKTGLALLIVKFIITFFLQIRMGCCVIDPKGDLFAGALFLLKQRLGELGKAEARELRRSVVVIDLSSTNPLSSYNIFARWPNAGPDFFASSRADLLLDLLPGGDGLSVAGRALLPKAILLLSEFDLPPRWLDDLLFDDAMRGKLLARSTDKDLIAYFTRQFPKIPQQTVAALSRRMEALFSSQALRCALSGRTAPDFRALQDDGKLVFVKSGGLSRGVRHTIQAAIASDFCQSVFFRKRKDVLSLLVPDEAQNFFVTERLRDQMSDFLCMSRSFGTHGLFLTQSIASAVQDARIANMLYTNIRWSFTMRGEASGAAFLKGALPLTGRKLRPQANPFEEPSFYSLNEERSLALDGIANLPDRTGYLWLKSRAREAFLMRTADIDIPKGDALDEEISGLLSDPTFGMRQSKKEYDRMIEQREREWRSEPSRDVNETLAGAYRRTRGEER